MGKAIIAHLENTYWGSDGKKPKKSCDFEIIPSAFRKKVDGLKVYFRSGDFDTTLDNYEGIKTLVWEKTSGSAWVSSLWSDYNRGYIKIVIHLAHAEYDENKIIRMIDKLVTMLQETKLHQARY